MLTRILVALLLVALYVTLGAGAIWLAFNVSNDPLGTGKEDFFKLAGIGLTLVTAVMTGLIALFNTATQLSMSRSLEVLRPLLALEFPAYKELNGAALTYHDALSRLDSGYFDLARAETAEAEMKKACVALFLVPDVYQKAWWDFWTEARFIKEHVQRELAANPGFDQKGFWAKRDGHGAKLAGLLEGLRKATPHR